MLYTSSIADERICFAVICVYNFCCNRIVSKKRVEPLQKIPISKITNSDGSKEMFVSTDKTNLFVSHSKVVGMCFCHGIKGRER